MTFMSTVASEGRGIALRPAAALLLAGSGVVAAGTCLAPIALLGEDRALTARGLTLGLQAGASWALLAGPFLVVMTAFTEHEGGLRAARFVAGQSLRRQGLAQLATALASVVVVTVTTACLTLLGGTADSLARKAVDGPGGTLEAPRKEWVSGATVTMLATALCVTAVVWMLTIAVRSCTRAVALTAGLLGSWVVLLLATRGMGNRAYLAAHPLAAPWHVTNPVASSALTLESPTIAFAASALAWLVILVVFTWRRLPRP